MNTSMRRKFIQSVLLGGLLVPLSHAINAFDIADATINKKSFAEEIDNDEYMAPIKGKLIKE